MEIDKKTCMLSILARLVESPRQASKR